MGSSFRVLGRVGRLINRHARTNSCKRYAHCTPTLAKNSSLVTPSILFSNHHLLVVNKPPGWHSIPIPQKEHTKHSSLPASPSKCMLTEVKRRRLGGGSQKDFLKPMHRIDQPCTGALLFTKNSKAASRVARAWKLGEVEKEYICVVESSSIDCIVRHSSELDAFLDGGYDRFSAGMGHVSEYYKNWEDKKTYFMSGIIQKRGASSVIVTSLGRPNENKIRALGNSSQIGGRLCHIEWRHLSSLPINTHGNASHYQRLRAQGKFEIIVVRTNSGARHQVRALLSAIGGCPIVGDLRYGALNGPLPDKSVALHARRLFLPTVKLGGTDLKNQPFVAPIPSTWIHFFGLTEDVLRRLECK
mmetsp:Transcript_50033/g.150519  ORF Transcript_50033/g.150519 Transcript_50033/m.150519 type:complete len:358 (-) Transcript_50033:588-1661(-)